MVAPGPAELADVEELVSISMHGMVVVRAKRKPDVLVTQVVTDVVNAATLAGSTVALHCGHGSVDPNTAIDGSAAHDKDAAAPTAIRPVGVGVLELRAEGAIWTVDFGTARFVRSDRPPHRLFLDVSYWTSFDAIWIGPTFVTALTADGSYIVGRRASCAQGGPVSPDHGQAPGPLRRTA